MSRQEPGDNGRVGIARAEQRAGRRQPRHLGRGLRELQRGHGGAGKHQRRDASMNMVYTIVHGMTFLFALVC